MKNIKMYIIFTFLLFTMSCVSQERNYLTLSEFNNILVDGVKWIGKGEVNRPLYQYLENKVVNFKLNNSFKNGQMFVAMGTKKE